MLQLLTDEYLSSAICEYRTRRDTAVEALGKISGVKTNVPSGGFYLVAQLPVSNAEEFATFMLTQFSHNGATTFVAPAAGFYMHANGGRDMIRIAFVLNNEDTRKAIEVLGVGIDAFNESKKGAA
jgi:aspartate aminotransferase